MSLSPVVSSTALSEDKVVWSENLSEWARSDGVHGTWLQIDQDCTWNIFASCKHKKISVHGFISKNCNFILTLNNLSVTKTEVTFTSYNTLTLSIFSLLRNFQLSFTLLFLLISSAPCSDSEYSVMRMSS